MEVAGGTAPEAMFAEARRLRTMLGVEGSIDPSQEYLGAIDPASEIVMKPVRAPRASAGHAGPNFAQPQLSPRLASRLTVARASACRRNICRRMIWRQCTCTCWIAGCLGTAATIPSRT